MTPKWAVGWCVLHPGKACLPVTLVFRMLRQEDLDSMANKWHTEILFQRNRNHPNQSSIHLSVLPSVCSPICSSFPSFCVCGYACVFWYIWTEINVEYRSHSVPYFLIHSLSLNLGLTYLAGLVGLTGVGVISLLLCLTYVNTRDGAQVLVPVWQSLLYWASLPPKCLPLPNEAASGAS